MNPVDLLTRLAVALSLGLLVGLEREWHARDQDGQLTAGFRTFALSGLLGGISAVIAAGSAPVVLGFMFAGFTGAFVAFHWLEARQSGNYGATSVVAGMLTFALGAYSVMGILVVAVAGAVAMVVLLALREASHRWVASLRREEIHAVLILLAMTFLMLPVMPDRPVDPWGILNPSEIWLLAIMTAAISFGGYVAIRLFGGRLGVVMAAVAGGLASSTATTLTLARLGKERPESGRLLAAGILVAGAVMVVRVGVIATIVSRTLITPLLPAIVGMASVLTLAGGLLLIRNSANQQPNIAITNPLDLVAALKLTAVIVVVMIAAELVHDSVGNSGVLIVAAASGLADVDAITISMARLAPAQLPQNIAVLAIALAMSVNTLTKAVLAGSTGGKAIGTYVGVASILAVMTGAAALFLRG